MELWELVLDSFLSILAVLGNGAFILLVITRRRLHTKANCFVLSLAVADSAFGVSFVPYLKLSEDSAESTVRDTLFLVIIALGAASSTNLCVMTLDRYIALVYPLRYVAIMRAKRVGILISTAWVVALMRPFLFGAEARSFRRVLDLVLYQIIPCVALLFATTRVLLIARRHSRQTAVMLAQVRHNYPLSCPQDRRKRGKNYRPLRRSDRSAKLLSVVVAVSIVCYCIGAYDAFAPLNEGVLIHLFHVLIFLNIAIKPVAYAFFKKDVKREMCIHLRSLRNNRLSHLIPARFPRLEGF